MDTDTLGKEVFFISSPGDVTAVRRQARRLAGEIGFDTVGAEEIALVVSELSSNLHKHASQGVISLTPLDDGVLKGLKVEATDHGPGIRDLNEAFADGYSSSGTLGDGLGSVNRLMDEFDIASEPGRGTHIVCRKWLRSYADGAAPCRSSSATIARAPSATATEVEAIERHEVAGRAQEQARQAFEIEKASYELGRGAVNDVLDSQAALLEAELAVALAAHDLTLAGVARARAAGEDLVKALSGQETSR